MGRVIVKLENVNKSFGSKNVVKNLNLEVYEGEFLTLLGSSGCGKTTILRMISGLESVSSGKVYIYDEDITDLEPPMRQVNTIFQNYALFPLMTIYDNIAFGLKMKKVEPDEIKRRVNDMLELVHLEGYENRYPRDLSGGEQQRVSLARGLINKPKVLLLDEPLSALDLKLRKQMQVDLKMLQKKLGITFIYVTHDQDEALSMSDRIVIIKNGMIEQIDSPIDIYEKPNSLYVAEFIGDTNVLESRVESIDNDKNLLYLDGNMVANNKNFKVGDRVFVVLRPENIKISKKLKKNNSLVGIVREVVYDGAFTKMIMNVGNDLIKMLVFGNDKRYKIGDELNLCWDIEDMAVFERDSSEE